MNKILLIFGILVVAVAFAISGWLYLKPDKLTPEDSQKIDSGAGTESLREASNPAISTLEACQAGCRNQYGGSGSPGFDACMRACGAGGVLREQAACGEPALACPSPQIPECKSGKWVCIGPATGIR